MWQAELDRTGRVVIRSARGRTALLLLVTIAFTAAGVLLAATGDDLTSRIGGWTAIVFFGLIGIPAIVLQLARPWEVIVTRQGVEVPHGFTVHWNDVTEVAVVQVQRTRMVALRLRSADAQRRAIDSGPRRRIGRVLVPISNTITGGTDLTLPSPLQADPRALAGWLDGMARA